MQAAFRDLKGNKQDAQMIESQRNFDGLRFWTCVTILNDAIALGLFLTGYVLRSMNDGISTVASYSIDIMSIALMGLQPCINRATYLQTLKCSLKTNISLTVKTSDVITEDGRNQTNKGSEHFSPDASSSAASMEGRQNCKRAQGTTRIQNEMGMSQRCEALLWRKGTTLSTKAAARDPTPIKVQQLPFKITGARDHYRDPKKKQSPDPLMLDASLFEKKFQRAPTQTYRYPVTSNMEYGWGWKKNLS
ncbi:hypothetical protein EDD86DRAFT_220291 [Gorgonomyces haynaldii]|nr:hypothetical protein EDD86DRAFT_220291 [Gorgonomyces haynaldii]